MMHEVIDPKMIRIWKKRLLVGAAFALGIGLVGCGAGAYGIYSIGKQVSANLDTGDLGAALPKAKDVVIDPVSGAVLAVASDWAAESIANGGAESVKQGLACIDALGGPNAGNFLNTLANRATRFEAREAMRRVSAELGNVGESRPASCIKFFAG